MPLDEAEPSTHRVDVDWLLTHHKDPEVVVVDVRWSMAGPSGLVLFEEGHIPEARYLDLDSDLSVPPEDGPGRHPRPTAQRFAQALARVGIGPETRSVIAYDDRGGAIAARLWWLLGYFGFHGQRAVLDGGIQAWTDGGNPLETGVSPTGVPAPLMTLNGDADWVVDHAIVEEALQGEALVLDARGDARYRGDQEPVDPRAGHIPGAMSAPYGDNLVSPAGPLRDLEYLDVRYEALGAFDDVPVIAYCGSGVTACHDIWVLTLLGREDVFLYEGSWSDWSARSELPAGTGPEP
ncbi:MAG: sulfurtransferase [Myxococcota bacterium]|nr:sulfurtransferase [Myxococcota bacterium]